MSVETPGSQSALREANRRRVLRAIRAAGSLTQAEIARATGLSAATVSNIVRMLRDDGTVVVTPISRGRRAQSVSLATATGMAIGVELGTSHIRAAVSDMAHRIHAEECIPYDVAHSASRSLRRVEWLVSTLLRQVRFDRSRVRGVGVAVPGPVAAGTGQMVAATLMPNWRGVDIVGDLSDRLGMPVKVINDAHASALGEMVAGAGRRLTDLVYLKLSSGVGAALILNGELYTGIGGFAGELGHITVNENGRICRCGNRGCLETVVGGPYLLDLLPRQNGEQPPTLRTLVDAALAGDLGSRRVIADAGRAVGSVAAILCNLLNPQRIIVGGELAEAGNVLLAPLRETLARQTLPNSADLVQVVPAEVGGRAAVIGALAVVVRSVEPGDDLVNP